METITETPNALVKIIEQSGLDKQKSDYILEKFADYTAIAESWAAKAKEIVVTNENQTAEMKLAREGRLLLKDKRVEIEKTRKKLKADSIKEGNAIDDVAKALTALIEPTEKYLDEQEKFAEREHAKRVSKLRFDRGTMLEQYIGDEWTMIDGLGTMNESQFNAMIGGYKVQNEAKIAAEKKLEEDRIAKEKADAEAREAQRIENERLKSEAEEREKIFRAERDKAEKERKAAEEKVKFEREAIEAKHAAEKQELDRRTKEQEAEKKKLQEQLNAEKKERERKENEAKEELERLQEQQRQAELAPDKTKLTDFANMLESIKLPELKSKKAKQLADDTKVMIATAANHIRTNLKKI